MRELDLLFRVNHPAKIQLSKIASHRDGAGTSEYENAMESYENKSLYRVIEGGLLTGTQKMIILLGTASANEMAHLHLDLPLNRICHCNLKPENIVLDFNFHPKVCDFGPSK
jgi:serine/threonine protein kinase